MKTKHFISRVYLFSLLALVIPFSSCSSESDMEPAALSGRQISKMVRTYLKDNKADTRYASFNIGSFKCDRKEDRDVYRKLEAAGVITLNIDTTKVSSRVKVRTNWWTGMEEYETRTRTVYTMTVDVTDETRRYMLDGCPAMAVDDPDMIQPVLGDFPEFHVDEEVSDTPVVEGDSPKLVYVKGTDISLVKVRNIEIDPINKREAICEFIIQNGKVTPAYRVLQKSYENQKFLMYAKLKYYVDKGWTIVRVAGRVD